MASIFTYDPDPPRVASPWLNTPPRGTTSGASVSEDVSRLIAEPQEGPVEYKLHLLLRPRRKFRSTSTGSHVSGSRHSKFVGPTSSRSVSESAVGPPGSPGTPPSSSMHQTRQHRLEQLTTQLLWRLQQSSPHHASSATNIILPSLPEALPELQAPQRPAKLLHGLEESQGALYEIGVSDDGSFVGLAEDEMEESLYNLRAMAASLGCVVEVLRSVPVGECEWLEDVMVGRKERKIRRSGKLLVAEALIKPYLQSNNLSTPNHSATVGSEERHKAAELPDRALPSTEQLRITLTGPTMSGKSSLLGTLSTSTLDNGRGKSRLSMLKHRHEINTGLTSSVTQELIGYEDKAGGESEIINYATSNVASWIDIHIATAGARLVFISDSAGHPRYRRTTVRGLVGWAPHWTLLCISADDTEDTRGKRGSSSTSQEILGLTVSDADLSGAQLDLCLRLNLPLVIVITKLDLASRAGLRNTLGKVLSSLKAAGKKPIMMPNLAGTVSEEHLQVISDSALSEASKMALSLVQNPLETVPIVLTSSVEGSGIGSLHALLHELPIPNRTDKKADPGKAIFHIEDIYNKPADAEGIIVSGHLRSNQISVGDQLYLGPFSSHDSFEDSEDSDERPLKRPSSHLPTSRSFPGALKDLHLLPTRLQHPRQEWRQVKVTSLRNLRLPVHSLLADQVGTVALAPGETNPAGPSFATSRIRKGMVLASLQPQATHTFVAEFRREDLGSLAVGSHVVVYIASVRASAKVLSARAPDPLPAVSSETEETFNLDFEGHESGQKVAGVVTDLNLLVTFHFDSSKEFVMIGAQVLVMPGGGPGLYGGNERGEKGVAGLEGFVGRITETFG